MSFARILRSSALMGGAQAVTLITAFIRSKLIAMAIGPAGIGLMGVFTTFNANLAAVAGWGLGASAVRTIAGSPDAEKEQKAASVRRLGRRLVLGGFVVVLALVLPVGLLTFGNQDYSLELLVAGLAVPCVIATGTWSSLLQAAGHVRTLARTQVISSVAGLLLGLPLIYAFGPLGVALSLFLAALSTSVITWREANRLTPANPEKASDADVRELVKLGVALQVGAILGAVSSYLVRVLILRGHGADIAAGLADAGFYQAAFAMTGGLPGVIFSASSQDFFPRVAAAADETEARGITETQIKASLLLAMPVLVALMTMGSLAMRALYAEGFDPATPLVSWFVWSIFCLLIGLPLAFWVMARRPKTEVAVSQSLLGFSGLLFALVLVPWAGLRGAAAAYFGSCLTYAGALLLMQANASGRRIGYGIIAWVSICAAALACGQLFASLTLNPYLGLVPTGATTAVCAGIYFKAVKASGQQEAGR
jgi:enterobacterial common antigen flippase